MELAKKKFQKKHSVAAVLIFVVGVLFFSAGIWWHVPPRQAVASGSYSYYSTVTVTSTASIASGTLTNFPMLVSSTEPYWEASSSGGTVQNICTDAHGNYEPCDLVFATSSANCGTANLNFETEKYVTSTGALVDWVNVPTMSTGTVIYACYDAPTVTTDQSNPSSTWNSNYAAVFHFNSSPTGTVQLYDSTANANNATNRASGTVATVGKIAGGAANANASASNYVALATSTIGLIGAANSSTFTIEGWFNPTYYGSEFNVVSDYSGNGFALRLSAGNETFYVYPNNNRVTPTVSAAATGTWYEMAGVVSGTKMYSYFNGAQSASSGTTNGLGAATTTSILQEPGSAGTGYGLGDEVRISKVPLTPQWISTEYYNIASTTQFYAVGAETSFSAGGTATSTWIATSSNSWIVPTNWSAGTIPGSTTQVLFSGSSTVSSTINTSTAVQAFTIASGYTGIITQSSTYTLTVATSGFSEAAGTFTGNTGNITLNGPFSLTGGTFTSTNGKLYLYGATTTFSGGTFNNNSGTVLLASTSTAANVSGSATFYDLWLGSGISSSNSTLAIATGTTLTVLASTTFAPSSTQIYLLGGGRITAQGDIVLSGNASGTAPTSTFSISLGGNVNQTINDGGYSTSTRPFYLPSLTISKTGGVVLVSSTYLVVQSTTVASGELRIASNTTPQTFIATSTLAVASGAVLSDYAGASSTVILGSTVANSGTIFFDGAGGGCLASSTPNYVILNSTVSGTQRAWSGGGTFIIRYTNVKDESSSVAIPDLNGTSTGDDGTNWTFTTGAEPELVQSTSTSGTSGTKTLTMAMPFWPRPGDLMVIVESVANQSLAAPTDTAGNAYALIASSTFGIDSLGLYYAKNVSSTQASFSVTGNATSSSAGNLLSVAAFEYTGITPSSALAFYNTNTNTVGATSLTSNAVSANATQNLFFGATSFAASTTLTTGSGWNSRAGIVNNNTTQAIYTEDIATTTALTTSATWTAATTTAYGDIIAAFRSPSAANFAATGTIDSATFDTGIASGSEINSVIWQGSQPSTTGVGFQFAVSNSTSGPWNYVGPSGAATYFGYTSPGVGIGPNIPINLGSSASNYSLLVGYRYFRYRMTLFADPSQSYAPTVNQVIVNWSP